MGSAVSAIAKPFIGSATSIIGGNKAKQELGDPSRGANIGINESGFTQGTGGTSNRAIAESNALQTRAVPTVGAARIDRAAQQEARDQQLGDLTAARNFAGTLRQRALGQAPSLAEAQLRSASDRNLRQQVAAAAAQRGGNQAALQRNLVRAQSEAGQALAQQAAQARLAEQQQAASQTLNAQQGLAQATGQVRSQDLGLASEQARLAQEASLANQSAQIQTQSQVDAQKRFLEELAFRSQQGDLQAKQALEELRVRQALGVGNLAERSGRARADLTRDTYKSIGNVFAASATGGAGGGAKEAASSPGILGVFDALDDNSDKNVKKDVKNATKDVSDFLSAISANKSKRRDPYSAVREGEGFMGRDPYSAVREGEDVSDFLSALSAKKFKYKDKKYGDTDKDRLGIMAQDLEKSEIGKNMVFEKDGVKTVDMRKGFGALLASTAELNKRLEELEKRSAKRKNKRGK